MCLYLVIYRNVDTLKTFYRLRTTIPPYKIGDITSMNWEVIEIQYFYKNRFYTYETYKLLISKSYHNYYRKREKKEKLKKIIDVLQKTFK